MKTYIVSGFMRCGTSMMMRALEAGGMDVAFNPLRDAGMSARFDDPDYSMNGGGFYELMPWEYREAGFPRRFEGKTIKVLLGALPRLVAGDYEIVFMRRAWKEIEASWDAATDRDLITNEGKFNESLENILGIVKQRLDMRCRELWYADVVANSKACFTALEWPIDVVAAAQIVSPASYRHRAA